MVNRLIWTLLLYGVLASFAFAVEPGPSHKLTEEEALSMLRTGTNPSAGAAFVVVAAIEPDPTAREVVTEPEARKNKDETDDEFPANFMRVGGFVILEYNVGTEMATRLHQVTAHHSGEPEIRTEQMEVDLRKEDALKILKKSMAFSQAFINSDLSGFKSTFVDYAGAAVANNIDPVKYGCGMKLPANIAKLAANPKETFDFVALACNTLSRSYRHALSLRVFGIDPLRGLAQAADDAQKAMEAFAKEKGETLEDSDPLNDLGRISTPGELNDRLQRLAELDAYLRGHLPVQSESDSYRCHVRFLSMPLVLREVEDPDVEYGVISVTGLATMWARTVGGDFILTGIESE
jgi:hypothetical protein